MVSSIDAVERTHETMAVRQPSAGRPGHRLGIMLATTMGVVALILFFSPNFQPATMRTSPLGSDFFQEWIGGRIWLSEHRSQLYDASYYQKIQHDSQTTGFDWPADQYYPMVYPPFYYLLVSPLATLEYHRATMVWLMILGAIAAATVFVFTHYFEPATNHWGKCLLALVTFYPFLISLNMGQKSVLLLLILCLTYLLLFHQRKFLAGAVFGLIAFKPHLGLLIGLVMLLKGQWRFVAGSTATLSLLAALSGIAGPDLCRDYFWQCLSMTHYSQHGGYRLYDAQNLAGVVELMIGGPSSTAWLIWSLLTGMVVALSWRALPGHLDFRSRRFALQYSGLVIATILLSPHFYTYDLTILLLPLALMVFAAGPLAVKTWSTESTLPRAAGSRWMGVLCGAIFVGCGVTSGIAESYHVQPVTFLLIAALAGIAHISSRSHRFFSASTTQP